MIISLVFFLMICGNISPFKSLLFQKCLLPKSWKIVRGARKGSSSSFSGTPHVIQNIVDALVNHDFSDSSAESILSLMNEVKLSHIGLDEYCLSSDGMRKERNENLYIPIVCTPQFDLAVFVIFKGERLPLHDHPKMSVMSKILHGEIRLQSYDLREEKSLMGLMGKNIAIFSGDEIKDTCSEAWMSTPSNGNIHDLYAIETTALLDILIPPYDYTRDCTYYEPVQQPVLNKRVELRTIPTPNGLPRFRPYRGLSVKLK